MAFVQSGLSKELLVEEIDTQRKDKQDRREHKKDAKYCSTNQKMLAEFIGAIATFPIMCHPTFF